MATMNDIREEIGLQPLPDDLSLGREITPNSEVIWSMARTGVLRKEDGSAEMVIYIPLKPEGY